jgi:hypothetical protein
MGTFFLILILLFQVCNFVLLAAVANILVRLTDRASKLKAKSNTSREAGLVDLPQVPNYAQVGSSKTSQGLVIMKDE